jgi:hypothetical protein
MYYEDLMENEDSSLALHGSNSIKKPANYYEKYVKHINGFWNNKYYKHITIENYGTGGHGSRIRNAVTGAYYNVNVGSSDEKLFFKVIDSSGYNGRNYPLMLYYDTPQQYENHHFIEVSDATKERWNERSQP